jgi:hypothetical protein
MQFEPGGTLIGGMPFSGRMDLTSKDEGTYGRRLDSRYRIGSVGLDRSDCTSHRTGLVMTLG